MSNLPTAKKISTGCYSVTHNGIDYRVEMYDTVNKFWSITPSVSEKSCAGLMHAKQQIAGFAK